MPQLPADILGEIFELLEDDRKTLYSCLLVNCLWCKIAVRILWRNNSYYHSKTFVTLIACLPNESKEILNNNGIIIPTPTSKSPMFNYAAFCKSLSIDIIESKAKIILIKNQQTISSDDDDFKNKVHILTHEILKLFMNQISSLKYLSLKSVLYTNTLNIYPGAENCLRNLSELSCNSNSNSNLILPII